MKYVECITAKSSSVSINHVASCVDDVDGGRYQQIADWENKGGEHRVFLSAIAMALIGVNKEYEEYVFPGDDLTKPISENSVAYHVRREIKSTGKIKFYGLDRFTPP